MLGLGCFPSRRLTEEERDETFGRSFLVVVEDMDQLAEYLERGSVDLGHLVLEERIDHLKSVRPAERLGLESFGESRETEASSLTNVRAVVRGKGVVKGNLREWQGNKQSFVN